jgi:hypothetical protein
MVQGKFHVKRWTYVHLVCRQHSARLRAVQEIDQLADTRMRLLREIRTAQLRVIRLKSDLAVIDAELRTRPCRRNDIRQV